MALGEREKTEGHAPSLQETWYFVQSGKYLAKMFRPSQSQDLKIDWTPNFMAG